MIIKVDSNEYALHPIIIENIKKSLQKRSERKDNYEMYSNNDVISQHLECGDYMFNQVLIEHKTLSDFCGSVINGRIFQQAQDMLHTKEEAKKIDIDMYVYILISGNISDIFSIGGKPQPSAMIAAWSSLNRMGIPTSFMGDQWFFTEGMLDLFEKHYDGKKREYNPVRKTIELEHVILTNYCSIPEIGEIQSRRLAERFRAPKDLYSVTVEQLMEIEGIGKKTAEKMVAFFEGKV